MLAFMGKGIKACITLWLRRYGLKIKYYTLKPSTDFALEIVPRKRG
jgi:hypothetical protein